VYKAIIKKRPSLPAYEEPTAPNSWAWSSASYKLGNMIKYDQFS
jgi:hypothetical protein